MRWKSEKSLLTSSGRKEAKKGNCAEGDCESCDSREDETREEDVAKGLATCESGGGAFGHAHAGKRRRYSVFGLKGLPFVAADASLSHAMQASTLSPALAPTRKKKAEEASGAPTRPSTSCSSSCSGACSACAAGSGSWSESRGSRGRTSMLLNQGLSCHFFGLFCLL